MALNFLEHVKDIIDGISSRNVLHKMGRFTCDSGKLKGDKIPPCQSGHPSPFSTSVYFKHANIQESEGR